MGIYCSHQTLLVSTLKTLAPYSWHTSIPLWAIYVNLAPFSTSWTYVKYYSHCDQSDKSNVTPARKYTNENGFNMISYQWVSVVYIIANIGVHLQCICGSIYIAFIIVGAEMPTTVTSLSKLYNSAEHSSTSV